MARQRLTLLALLTVMVAALHACVGRAVGDRLEALRSAAALPPRMTVAYVKTLQQSAPPPPPTNPVTPPSTPPSPPSPRRPRPHLTPAAEPAPAPAPEPVSAEPDPPPPPETVASAPEATAAPETPASAVTASAPASAPTPDGKPAFAWPSATRLSYELGGQFRGELHGSAQVEWIRRDDHYQVYMDLGTGPLFAFHMRSEGRTTPDGLVPGRYDQQIKFMFKDPRRLSMQFDAEGVMLASGQRVPGLPGVQDTASQFVQLTYLFRSHPERLRPGNQIEVPLALPRHVSTWVYEVLQPEVLSTPIGPLETFQLRPHRNNGRPSDLKAEIWFAPTLQYLPVRIRIVQDENLFLDLLIAKDPEISE